MISLEAMGLRLVTAAVLGGVVGLERERLDRGAGLRTHAVAAVGACLCMLVSSFGFTDVQNQPNNSLDPSRVASQVVSGIGFLGAGTIMMRRNGVRGLTTAASLWAVAGIGLAAGGGLLGLAAITAVLTLGILIGLKPVERHIAGKRIPVTGGVLTIRCRTGTLVAGALEAVLAEAGVELERLVLSPRAGEDEDRLEVTVAPCEASRLLLVVDRLRGLDGVTRLVLDAPTGLPKGTAYENMG